MTKGFYDRNQEALRKITPILKSDNLGRPLLYVSDGVKDYLLSFYDTEDPMAPIQYYALDTLQKKYKIDFIRRVLEVDDFQSYATRQCHSRKEIKQLITQLQNAENNLPDVDSVEMTKIPNAAETAVKEIETSFTQTDMTKREMDGIIKAMTTVKEEIANE
ncbi:hypothetical protein ACF0H5_018367 [Mactra antiquata]